MRGKQPLSVRAVIRVHPLGKNDNLAWIGIIRQVLKLDNARQLDRAAGTGAFGGPLR